MMVISYCSFSDFVDGAATGFDDLTQILKSLSGLLCDPSIDDGHRLGIHRKTSRDKDESVGTNGL